MSLSHCLLPRPPPPKLPPQRPAALWGSASPLGPLADREAPANAGRASLPTRLRGLVPAPDSAQCHTHLSAVPEGQNRRLRGEDLGPRTLHYGLKPVSPQPSLAQGRGGMGAREGAEGPRCGHPAMFSSNAPLIYTQKIQCCGYHPLPPRAKVADHLNTLRNQLNQTNQGTSPRQEAEKPRWRTRVAEANALPSGIVRLSVGWCNRARGGEGGEPGRALNT